MTSTVSVRPHTRQKPEKKPDPLQREIEANRLAREATKAKAHERSFLFRFFLALGGK